MPDPPSPPEDQTVAHLLANAQVAVTVAANASNMVPVPALPVILGAVGSLLTVIQTTRTNKEDCKLIAKRANVLIGAISDLQSGANIDRGVRQELENLKATLGQKSNELADIARHDRLLRFLTSKVDSKRIQDLKDDITSALQNFQLWISIAQYSLSAEAMEELRKLVVTSKPPQDAFVYSKLPAFPSIFLGRQDYVASAVSLILTKSPARLAILGPGGMGKTSVAVAILHDPQIKNHFGQARCFVSCEAALTAEMLHTTLRQELNVQISAQDPKKSLVEAVELAGQLLLVLDNLETPWNGESKTDVEVLLRQLHDVKTLTLIITMRGTVYPSGPEWSNPDWYPLPPLDVDSSKSAYLRIYSKNGDEADLNILLKEIECLPLAITLSAKVAQSQRWSPSRMLQEWKEYHTGLLTTDSLKSNRLCSLDVPISLSIKQLEHDSIALQLLTLVCTLPDGIFKNQWPTIASLFQDKKMIGKAAQTLRMSALAYEDKDRELHVLSPIRFHVQESPDLKLELPETLHQKLRQLYFGFAGHSEKYLLDSQEKKNLLSEESGNIKSMILSKYGTMDTENMVHAALTFSKFLYWTYPSSELLVHALKHSKNVPAVKGPVKGKLFKQLGEIYQRLNEYNKAIPQVEAAKQEFDSIGDRLGAAQCMQSFKLGNIARMQGKYRQASSQLEAAKQEFESIGNRLGAAQCLQRLGDIACMQNKYGQATIQVEAAKQEFESIGSRLGAAQCLQRLGDIACMQNKYGQATIQLEAAKQEFESIGSRLGAAQCLRSLGDIARMQNEYGQAITQLEAAKQEFESISNRLGAAQCLQRLGDIACMQNKYGQATTQLEAAKQEFENIGSRVGVAQCLQSLGDIACMQDEYGHATIQLEAAKQKFESIGDKLGAAQCLQHLSDIAYIQSDT